MPNYNPDTGTPYGTIYLHHLNGDVANDLFYEGENVSVKNALEELRAEITADVEDENDDRAEFGQTLLDACDMADEIDRRFEAACECIEIDEPVIVGESDGVKYMISWLGGAPLLWVFSSPFTGSYAQCSPCVPGAGDLETPDEYGVLCYDVPKEWRCSDEP